MLNVQCCFSKLPFSQPVKAAMFSQECGLAFSRDLSVLNIQLSFLKRYSELRAWRFSYRPVSLRSFLSPRTVLSFWDCRWAPLLLLTSPNFLQIYFGSVAGGGGGGNRPSRLNLQSACAGVSTSAKLQKLSVCLLFCNLPVLISLKFVYKAPARTFWSESMLSALTPVSSCLPYPVFG